MTTLSQSVCECVFTLKCVCVFMCVWEGARERQKQRKTETVSESVSECSHFFRLLAVKSLVALSCWGLFF